MPQITILDRDCQVIDTYIASRDLYFKLKDVYDASLFDFFTLKQLKELQTEFLHQMIDENKFNLCDRDKDMAWHLERADSYAFRLFCWYQDFIGLLNVIASSPLSDSDSSKIFIWLTSP